MPERYRQAHRGTGSGSVKKVLRKRKQYRTTNRLMKRAEDRGEERLIRELQGWK